MRFIRTLKARPRIFFALLVMISVYFLLPHKFVTHLITRALLAWDFGLTSYLIFATLMILKSTPEKMKRRAIIQAESQGTMIFMVVIGVIIALTGIFMQSSLAKNLEGQLKIDHIILIFITTLLTWFFTHLMFALHYAHEFYAAEFRGLPQGLQFPETAQPDYLDFIYCAFIIGTSGQTADVGFSSQSMRRIGLVQSVLAFFFNTALIGLTINAAAGIF